MAGETTEEKTREEKQRWGMKGKKCLKLKMKKW